MRALWPVFLLFFSALAQAVVGNCPSNFPDGLQSPYSGTAASKGIIDFGFNAQLLSNPDSVLAAKTVNRNGGSTLLTCNSANCTASGSTAPTQDAGTFPTTSGYTTVLDVPFNTTQSLAGNGSNQYKTINLNAQTQLTINSSGQSFYIDQLSISSGSILRLAPGDYWVRSLNVGFQSQIQVQGSGLVRLFVRDNWALSSSALLNSPAINSSGTANNLYLYNYGSFILNNQATLSGYVYSANQQGSNQAISLDSPSYVFGALSGENISLATDARVNYVAPAGSCVVVSSKYWWAMDEAQWSGATGEVLESSGSGLTGRGLGGAQTASATPALSNSPGTCGYGTYSGTSSRVEVADNSGLDFSTELSAGLWVRPTATPTATVVLLGKGTNYQLALNSSRQLVLTSRFVYGLGAGSSETLTVTTPIGSALPLNQWTHVGFSLDFFEAFFVADYIAGKIFINGVQSGSGQTSAQFFGATVVNSAVLQIGGSGSTGLVGWVDEVRLDQSVLLASNFADQMVYRHNCPVQASVDHYELVYASNQALTCNPLSVTLKACQNSACSSLYSGSVSASLTPAGVPNNWSSNPVTFTGNSALQFQRTNLGSAVLGVSATPTASNATQCIVGGVSGNCTVTFADSGFIFNVPNALAAKPVSTTINAVKADPANPQACIPGFASGSRSVAFTRSYSNPNTGTQSVSVNGTPVTSATPVTLNFDATATAQLTVQYNDAGEMALAAKYAPTSGLENGLDMNGSDLFVSRPYGLLLQTDTLSSCTVAGISCPLYPGSVRAGDSFNLKIKAVAWQSDGEPLTVAALADNPATPNFQLSNIALSSQLLAPAGGSAGTLGVGSYSHVLGTVANSNSTTVSQSVSEVGVFTLTATPPVNGYFGDTVNASVSGLVGRFAPAYLSASGSASLTPSCGAAFSYQGQPMAFAVGQEPSLTVTGKNRSGGVTNNYDRGDFWRLGIPTREPYLSVTTKASIDAVGRLTSSPAVSPVQSGADSGDGARSYRWSGETLQYSPAVLPLTDDLPFTAAVRQGFSAAALTDADAVCNGVGSSCLAFSYDFTNVPGSEVRLGRLRLSNAHGSELQGLALPFNLETWQAVAGASFQAELTDSCTTALVLGTPELSSHTGNLAVGETLATVSGPLAAAGQVQLSAPGAGNDGSVQARFASQPTWLYYDWDATGLSAGRRAARGLASFGIYQGAKPLIFRRELYRTP